MIRTSVSFRHVTGAAVGAAAVIGLVLSVGCASAPTTAPPQALGFPSPNSGPGRPDLTRVEKDHIEDGWSALRNGDWATARASATQVGANAAAELLTLQATMVSKNDAIPGLERLTDDHPGYAAAWLTLSLAAEKANDESVALAAAARGAELWPERRWDEREQMLRQMWVGGRIDSALALYEADDPEAALEALVPALALEPENQDAVLLKARAFIALDRLDRAEAVLAGLPREPEVVRLAGNIAEARGDLSAAMRIYSSLPEDPESVLLAVGIAEGQGDWDTAMSLYQSLPDERPEKGPGLRRAKLRWRISVMPGYVQEAFDSLELNRAQLAVVIVTLVPRVETWPGGQVPLLSDVMTLPAQDEILTAARLGLIASDEFLHRFHPERPVTAAEVRYAVDGLAQLLELDSPMWCTDESGDEPCAAVVEPVSGEAAASIVIEVVAREGDVND
jgi:tetratricopeptide (TPR) repeat protein